MAQHVDNDDQHALSGVVPFSFLNPRWTHMGHYCYHSSTEPLFYPLRSVRVCVRVYSENETVWDLG